jgi:hypothetical protein
VVATAPVTPALSIASLGSGRVQLLVMRAVFVPAHRIFRRLLIAELHALFCFWHFGYFLFFGLLFVIQRDPINKFDGKSDWIGQSILSSFLFIW